MTMMCSQQPRDGYYDEQGVWQRTKFCFVYCGPERCTCQPPMLGAPAPEPQPDWDAITRAVDGLP